VTPPGSINLLRQTGQRFPAAPDRAVRQALLRRKDFNPENPRLMPMELSEH